ncbi:MAG: hypothetical protein K6E19_02085 [Lachnospiraceae bacterium]|nr:hypothetical protein [Lachnospiraceae bacterium]
MHIDERLAKQNKELQKKKQKRTFDDDGEDTLTYAPWKVMEPLNKYKGAFNDNSGSGINTAQSVFDRTAVFHTGKDQL